MQSHASRRVASESLSARHPYQGSAAFSGELRRAEVAVAYGARCLPKLAAVLTLPHDELPAAERAHALRTFLGQCSNQENKASAVAAGAVGALVDLLAAEPASDKTVRQLSCLALASLCTLASGRKALFEAGGVATLCTALKDANEDAREAAAGALETVSSGRDGSRELSGSADSGGVDVIEALVQLVRGHKSSAGAVAAGVATLCNLSCTDAAIAANLRHHAVKAVLARAEEALVEEEGADFVLAALSAKYLRHLCHHPVGKVQVLEAGALPTLAAMLTCYDLDVRRLAAGALMGLAVEMDAKLAIATEAGDGLAGLLCGGGEADFETAENALIAAQNVCEHPPARATLCEKLDDEARYMVLGAGYA